jgi:hypothetical protein
MLYSIYTAGITNSSIISPQANLLLAKTYICNFSLDIFYHKVNNKSKPERIFTAVPNTLVA